MSKKSSPLFAVVIGTLSHGFSVSAVDTASGVELAVNLAREHKVFVELAPVLNPADKISRFSEARSGDIVVFTGTLGGGEFHGPFADEDIAEEFGEAASEDGEYRVFEVKTV